MEPSFTKVYVVTLKIDSLAIRILLFSRLEKDFSVVAEVT
jgi:hypothetical protein